MQATTGQALAAATNAETASAHISRPVTILSADFSGDALGDAGPMALYALRAYAHLHGYKTRLTEERSWNALQSIRASMYTAAAGELLVWMHNHTFISNAMVPLREEWEGLGSPDISILYAHPVTAPHAQDQAEAGPGSDLDNNSTVRLGGRIIVRNSPGTVSLFDELIQAGRPWDESLWRAYQASIAALSLPAARAAAAQGQGQAAVTWAATATACANANCSYRHTPGCTVLDSSVQPVDPVALRAVAYSSILSLPHPMAPVVVTGSDQSRLVCNPATGYSTGHKSGCTSHLLGFRPDSLAAAVHPVPSFFTGTCAYLPLPCLSCPPEYLRGSGTIRVEASSNGQGCRDTPCCSVA